MEYQYNYFCLPANKYVHWVNEWRFNIYYESWTIYIRDFEKTPFKLFIIHVRQFWGGVKKTKNRFSLVRPDELFFSLMYMYHSQQPTWDNSGILSFNFALLVLRINSRMPPPDGGCDFLDLTGVWDINKRKNAKEKWQFFSQSHIMMA